jgi:hypothetical protein
MSARSKRSGISLFGAGALAALSLTSAVARAQEPEAGPAPTPPAPAAGTETPVRTAPLIGPRSRLPATGGAELWVDLSGIGSPGVTVLPTPGRPAAVIRQYSVLVFRPVGDNLSWEELTALYVNHGLLPSAPPVLNIGSLPPLAAAQGSPLNARDTRLYKAKNGSDYLALGLIRNLRSRNQLAYAVLLAGKLDNVQAALQANALAETLANDYLTRRNSPPIPMGAVSVQPSVTATGARLSALQSNIASDRSVSPRVKELARLASSATLYQLRTAAPLTDRQFLEFYTREAASRGWGQPISQDETRPGYPTLLFQRPTNDGVMMVRAAPSPPTIGGLQRPGTIIVLLMMEGRFTTTPSR